MKFQTYDELCKVMIHTYEELRKKLQSSSCVEEICKDYMAKVRANNPKAFFEISEKGLREFEDEDRYKEWENEQLAKNKVSE
ncbi:MAG TPA: hypothetical protein PLG47_05215 [Candidatus Dojkabacteria bacterium]|nr:hypothetical protein [Caldisericia bacterium]HPQ79829.1 hypothetical protein [Candidatus Dojkabacteria bacterium]